MISTLKKKLNKKGFTLAELLIVVAIIAVLVAIAIPTFSAQLEKARASVDTSNMRAAESLAMADYLLNAESYTAGTPVYYSVDNTDDNLSLTDLSGSTTDDLYGGTSSSWTGGTLKNQAKANNKADNSKQSIQIVITDGKITDSKWA